MPLITGTLTSYNVDRTATDISRAFFAPESRKCVLLDRCRMGIGINGTRADWDDDVPNPTKTKLGGAYTAGATSVAVVDHSAIKPSTILQIGDNVVRVTAVTEGTAPAATLTVVVLESGSNQSSGAAVEILGNAQVENATADETDSFLTVPRYNLTQILREIVLVSGTQAASKRPVADGANLLTVLEAKKLDYLYEMLGAAIWRNPRIEPSDNTSPRVLGGVAWFIKQYGQISSATAFARANIDSWLAEMESGKAPIRHIWCSPAVALKFNGLNNDKLIIQQDSKVAGNMVASYQYRDQLVEVIADPSCTYNDRFFLFPADRVALRTLRSMQSQPLAKTGDGERKLLVGEYSLEVNQSAQMGAFVIS